MVPNCTKHDLAIKYGSKFFAFEDNKAFSGRVTEEIDIQAMVLYTFKSSNQQFKQ